MLTGERLLPGEALPPGGGSVQKGFAQISVPHPKQSLSVERANAEPRSSIRAANTWKLENIQRLSHNTRLKVLKYTAGRSLLYGHAPLARKLKAHQESSCWSSWRTHFN